MTFLTGALAATVSVICFGSNFVPVKGIDTGDGVFFQWVMCTAIWMVGVLVNFANGSPKFEPLAMLGGALWCTGNMLCVPVINMIGMGMGLLLWGSMSLLTGWASGRFGFFGLLHKQAVSDPTLNSIGVVFCLISLCLFFPIETEETPKVASSQSKDAYGLPLLQDDKYGSVNGTSFTDTLGKRTKKLLGVALSLVAGVFFGVNFNPPQYLIDNPEGIHSTHSRDYVFSHFSGIFFASTIYLILYAIYMRGKPFVTPEIVLPGFLSGLGWAIAQTAFFIANANWSFSISFPIIATGPGIVGAIWGVGMFGEIKGRRNFMFLGAAIASAIIGVILVAQSA